MPIGVYKRTAQHRKLLSDINKARGIRPPTYFGKANPFYGHTHTEEARRKIAAAHVGRPSWNKGKPAPWSKKNPHLFKKGRPAWNKGKHLSATTREKLRRLAVGRIVSLETRRKQSAQRQGAVHWNWRGGITPLIRQIRNCLEYKLWRFACFTRDNFKCVLCGNRRCKGKRILLEVDHFPVRFSTIIRKWRISSFEGALQCADLWDINNGRTLCKACHKKHTFGHF